MFILTLWQIASFASNDTIIALFNKMDELRKKIPYPEGGGRDESGEKMAETK